MTDAAVKEKAARESSERTAARGFRLLDESGTGAGTTIRDDQHPFAWLLDASGLARRRGRRFRLVDSGKLDAFSLEWLAASGADIYTSDDIRPVVSDLARLRRAGKPSGALVVFFHNGPLEDEAGTGGPGPESLRELLSSGVDVHLSNRKRARPAEVLRSLALSRRAGESELVYYHHGPLDPEVEALAEAGAWVHIGDAAVALEADSGRIGDLSRAARRARGGLILHVENETDPRILSDFRRAGAYILNKLPAVLPEDEKTLPFRAYYIDTTFMP